LFCVHLGVMGNWRNRPPRRIFRQPRAPWPPPEPHDPGPPPGNSKLLLLFNFLIKILFLLVNWGM
jgi:hypothetical protein